MAELGEADVSRFMKYLAESVEIVKEWPEWKRSDFDYGDVFERQGVPEKIDEDLLKDAAREFFESQGDTPCPRITTSK